MAAYFDYMKGTDNELADRHIPELPKRNDTLAGRRGRRSDMCGGWTFMTRDDITRVGPLWLKYTEDVRFDEEVPGLGSCLLKVWLGCLHGQTLRHIEHWQCMKARHDSTLIGIHTAHVNTGMASDRGRVCHVGRHAPMDCGDVRLLIRCCQGWRLPQGTQNGHDVPGTLF